MTKKAFTFSEVLITLFIIGIVATATLQPIIQKYKKLEATTRLKHFYSMMTQAILSSEIDNGPSKNWTKDAMAYNADGTNDTETNRSYALKYFYTYIEPYIKHGNIIEKDTSYYVYVYLFNGSYFRMHNGVCIDFAFDVNGGKPPNEHGKDMFRFLLCPENYANYYCGSTVKNFCTYTLKHTSDREQALKYCKTSALYCARLLELDGWEFRDDYPYKL